MIGYVWHADDWVCVVCRHLGMCGMQTFRYAWSLDIQVCVEWRHSGVHVWIASVREHEHPVWKELLSAV